MSESVPGALVIGTFLLISSVTFLFLLNVWVDHDTLQKEVATSQEARLETALDITNIEMSPDFCAALTGPYDATIQNIGASAITDLPNTDVLVEYLDASDNKIVDFMQHGTDWSVSSITPDDRNPNQWDSAETATVRFSLSPGIKPDSNGVFLLASPGGVSDSKYFTWSEDSDGVTGLMSPTSESADTGGDGDGFEISPTSAFDDDGAAASSVNVLLSGDNHRFYDYGISIHSGCVIEGIEVRIDWWLLNTLGENSLDVELSWDGGNSWTSAKNDSVETTSEHSTTLGSDSDTWGRTWSPSDFTNSNFRVRVTTIGTTLAQTYFLDWVGVNVYYIAP